MKFSNQRTKWLTLANRFFNIEPGNAMDISLFEEALLPLCVAVAQEAVAAERERLAQRYQESARDLEDEAFERAPAALRRSLYLKLADELLKDQTL